MDKNRAVVALIVIVFVFVSAMLYVLFASNKQDVAELEDPQAIENEYAFDINSEIDNVQEGEDDILSVETSTKKDEIKTNSEKTETKLEIITKTSESPETGPGSIAAVMALALGAISAGVVYKKESKTQR